MNGFPVTALVNRMSNELTEQLVRLDERRYAGLRRSVLQSGVKDRLIAVLRREFPTVFVEYLREQGSMDPPVRINARPEAEAAHHAKGGET